MKSDAKNNVERRIQKIVQSSPHLGDAAKKVLDTVAAGGKGALCGPIQLVIDNLVAHTVMLRFAHLKLKNKEVRRVRRDFAPRQNRLYIMRTTNLLQLVQSDAGFDEEGQIFFQNLNCGGR